jgi:hypothetical protein
VAQLVLGVLEIDRGEILKAWWRRISKISQRHAHWNAGIMRPVSWPAGMDPESTPVSKLHIIGTAV